MMDSRQVRMDEFLKNIASIYHAGPSVYGTLIRNEITKYSNETKPIANIFSKWIEHFQSHPHIDVFISGEWKYFLQFTKETQVVKDNNFKVIKIYVPLDLAHIEEGAKQLFEFIGSRGFCHVSKIGSDERMDNIVIRVVDRAAADEIAAFINSNSYIKKGLMKPNPFCLSDGNICFAADNFLSFNDVLSEYIEDYIRSYQGSPDIGLEHFSGFVTSRYHSYFVDGERINVLANNKRDNMSQYFEGDLNALLVNYQQVTELILKSLDSKSTLYDFAGHLDNLAAEQLSNEKYNNLKALQEKSEVVQPFVSGPDESEHLDMIPDVEILNNVIMTNYNKYGLQWVLRALTGFMNDGRLNGFSRDNDSRKKMNAFTQNQVYSLMKEQLGSEFNNATYLNDYIEKVTNTNEVDFLRKACLTTYQKYGFNHANGAIIKYLRDNNPKSFTNDDLARRNLISNVSYLEAKNKMIQFLASRGNMIEANNDPDIEISEIAMQYLTCLLNEIELEKAKII